MIRELKETREYTPTVISFAALATVFGFAFIGIGEIFLPPASAFLALTFVLEKPSRRYLSYIASVLPVLLAFINNGIYGIVSLEYVLVALSVALTYRLKGSRAECAAYTSLIIAAFTALSLYFGATKTIGSFNVDAVFDYYSEVLTSLKYQMQDLLNSYVLSNNANASEMLTKADMSIIFESLTSQIISLIGIFAFLMSGITIKLFSSFMLKVTKRGMLRSFAHFLPSNIVAYGFVAVLIISIFSGNENVFEIVILNLSNILSAVFAYLGLRYLITALGISGRRGLGYSAIIFAFLMFPGAAIRILSLLGVYATVGTNNAINGMHRFDEE